MSGEGIDFEEYRDGILRIHDLASQARNVAKELVHNDYPAVSVRKRLYDAMNSLARAAELVDQDLIGKSSTDVQYERDFS